MSTTGGGGPETKHRAMPRHTCKRCGMTGVELIVAKSGCLNAGACARRVARNKAKADATKKAERDG